MKKRELVSLLFRLMVVYAMFQFVPSLLYVIAQLSVGHASDSPVMAFFVSAIMLITPLIWIGMCWIVLRFSNRIAARIVPDDGDATAISALSFKECQMLGYNFIGLLLVVKSFPQLIQLLSTLRVEASIPHVSQAVMLQRSIPRILAFLSQFVIGLFLFLRARGLSNLWEKLQASTRPMRTTPSHR